MSIYTWTGNPFVDAGISAILVNSNKKNPEEIDLVDVEKMIDLLVEVYLTEPWKKNMYSIFPNNPITNPSIKQKETGYKEYLESIFNNIENLGERGNCIACGRRDSKRPVNKMHLPLTGYEGSHFFSFKTSGADLCSACNFAIQCSPLTLYACGKLALIHSNSVKVMKYWAKQCLNDVHRQIAIKNFTGCYNEKYLDPVNALFHIATNLVQSYEEQWIDENAAIRIYHFTNYNQGPDLDIYDLPTPVFRFLVNVRVSGWINYWYQIVRRGYSGKIEGKSDEEIRNYRNAVYQNLLNNHSILNYFINYDEKLTIGDWHFLEIYLKEVRKMDEQRIRAIKRIGDIISDMIKNTPNGKRRLTQLEMAKNYHSCRMVLLRLMQDRVTQKLPEPLIKFDEYVEFLFPEGAIGWNETRDLILFRIYENLHEWLVSEGIVPIENEDEKIAEAI